MTVQPSCRESVGCVSWAVLFSRCLAVSWMAKLGFEVSCGHGLTSPHQMDPLCLSTRTHWVHRLAVLSRASQVPGQCFFPALANHSRVWILGRQLITLLPISSWTHPTPARPTQLRIALYNVMSSHWTVLQFLSLSHLFSSFSVKMNLFFVPWCSVWKT